MDHPKKTVEFCSVNGCGSKGVKNAYLNFHAFPRQGSILYIRDEHGVEKPMDRKKVWEMILLMKSPATHLHRVCSLHFSREDYHLSSRSNKSILRKHAIPTLNLPQSCRQESPKVRCMVPDCHSKAKDKTFVLMPPKRKQIAFYRWNSWMQALGLSPESEQHSWLGACSKHFITGRPSTDRNDPDFVPSINVNKSTTQIEDITLDEHSITPSEIIITEDPLSMDHEEFLPDFVNEPPEMEDCIKIELVDFEMKVEVEEASLDHNYYVTSVASM